MAFSTAVLQSRNFRLLLFTRIFGMMALQAQDVIVGWQIYSLTHDPFMLGLAGLTEAVPAIICALVAGHIVDVSRPHFIFLICMGVLAVDAFALLMIGGGIISVHNILPWLFSGIFISGLARSFIMPASFLLLSRIVERPKIAAASAWLSGGYQAAAVTGPAIVGLIYGGYGAGKAWLLPVSLMTIAFVTLAGIEKIHRQYKSAEKREPAVKSIRAGWKFIIGNQVLLSVMALDMFAVLFGGAVAMLPAFADQVLHVGSEGLGILRASPAVGSVMMALVLALWPLKKIHAKLLLWAVAGFGVCMIGFGLSKVFWLAALFLILSGAFDSISMVIRSTLMQLLTPDSMRGRVSAVNSMFIISSNEIGAFESGLAAKLLGLVPSIIIGGIGALIVVGAAAMFPKLRNTIVKSD